MLSAVIIIVALLLAGYLAFSKRLAASAGWKATVTPLASIMGSGFLVSAPLLAGIVGKWAVACMAALLVLAYAVGSAIRFNIRHFEPIESEGHGPAQDVAFVSRVVLAGAYFISVTYYLQLLAAFVLKIVGMQSEIMANGITTLFVVVIGGVGIWRGLHELEQVETYAISLNLGMIGALLVGLTVYNVGLLSGGQWQLPRIPSNIDLHDLRVLLGLLIVVQGFETSRYLGDEHGSEQRIATMRWAQLVSGIIYVLFIGLATILFRDDLGADVTAIINMTSPVAVVLPLLLSVAAIGSQFSAAVADNSGAGGLLEDITQRRLSIRYALSVDHDHHRGPDVGDERQRHHRLRFAGLCALLHVAVQRGLPGRVSEKGAPAPASADVSFRARGRDLSAGLPARTSFGITGAFRPGGAIRNNGTGVGAGELCGRPQPVFTPETALNTTLAPLRRRSKIWHTPCNFRVMSPEDTRPSLSHRSGAGKTESVTRVARPGRQTGRIAMKHMKYLMTVATLLTLILPVLAAAAPGDDVVRGWVQEALRNDPRVASPIDVSVLDNIVTLKGSLKNLAEQQYAVLEARKISGVMGVIDETVVTPVFRLDTALVSDIERRLADSPSPAVRGLVVSAADGRVTLQGEVASWSEKQQAGLLASEVRGVRKVDNNVRIVYGEPRTDDQILHDVRASIDRDVYLVGLPIQIAVTDGTVTLMGEAGSVFARERATQAAWVDGVDQVNNEVEVVWWEDRGGSYGLSRADRCHDRQVGP